MEAKKTTLDKITHILIAVIGVSWFVAQVNFSFFNPINPMTIAPIFLCFAVSLIFLMKPFPGSKKFPLLRILDFLTIPVCGWVAWYFFAEQTRIITRIPHIAAVTPLDIAICIVMMLFLLEAVRRTIGLNLLVFLGFFLIYCIFGPYFPGVFRFGGFDLNQFTEVMSLTSNGIYGTPLATTASYIFYFIIFGAFFAACGGGQVLIDIGMRFSNPKSGGPAKAAVLSSGLMGMISGSAVANVSTTGVMTIPMMKKAGYTPEQAAAVEAVASTGGQIMPPIMGVGAFIMAELLGVNYGKIAISAAIPALAYFGSIFFLVSFLAKRNYFLHPDLNISEEELKFKVAPLLPRLFLLIPAIILVAMVLTGSSLRLAALYGTLAVVILNIVNPKRANLKELFEAFLDGIRQCANIAIPVAACGIIIGVVVQSGLANKFAAIVSAVGNSSLLLALLLTMLCCMLLGMAMPTVAAYLISVTLFASALVRLGLPLMVVHMFCFYFGVMAQITPPVCLASFTAAAIADADSWKTGWTGFVYASVAFIVPYAFAYEPALLLQGPILNTITASITLFIGCYALAAAIAGFLLIPLNKWLRIILLVCAITCIIPGFVTDAIGLVMLALVYVYNFRQKKKLTAAAIAA